MKRLFAALFGPLGASAAIALATTAIPANGLAQQDNSAPDRENVETEAAESAEGDLPDEASRERTDRAEGRSRNGNQAERSRVGSGQARTRQGEPEDLALGVFVRGLEDGAGAWVRDVVPNSPAAQAGIEAGDLIVGVEGRLVRSPDELIRAIDQRRTNTQMELTVIRNQRLMEFRANLGEERRVFGRARQTRRPDSAQANSENDRLRRADSNVAWLGVAVDGTEQSERGVTVAALHPNGPAKKAGVKLDDTIVRVGEKQISSPEQLARVINARQPEDEVRVTVLRDGEEKSLEITLASRREFSERNRDQSSASNEMSFDDPDNCEECKIMLEQQRQASLQRERIETLVSELQSEIQDLREAIEQQEDGESN